MNKKELWHRIKNYHFENLVTPGIVGIVAEKFGGIDASTKAFANKIARKHGMRNSFTLYAVNEYKKFVYLGVVSDFHVTPSKVIDVVWHEHILFSKAYRDFCDNVIKYKFDHQPELIPQRDQTGQFNQQYIETLTMYKTEFGVDPPPEIWGITKFDKDVIKSTGYTSGKKKQPSGIDSGYSSDPPLCSTFDSSDSGSGISGFHGGDFGGGGAGGDWSDTNGTDAASDSGGDAGGCSAGCGGGGD